LGWDPRLQNASGQRSLRRNTCALAPASTQHSSEARLSTSSQVSIESGAPRRARRDDAVGGLSASRVARAPSAARSGTPWRWRPSHSAAGRCRRAMWRRARARCARAPVARRRSRPAARPPPAAHHAPGLKSPRLEPNRAPRQMLPAGSADALLLQASTPLRLPGQAAGGAPRSLSRFQASALQDASCTVRLPDGGTATKSFLLDAVAFTGARASRMGGKGVAGEPGGSGKHVARPLLPQGDRPRDLCHPFCSR